SHVPGPDIVPRRPVGANDQRAFTETNSSSPSGVPGVGTRTTHLATNRRHALGMSQRAPLRKSLLERLLGGPPTTESPAPALPRAPDKPRDRGLLAHPVSSRGTPAGQRRASQRRRKTARRRPGEVRSGRSPSRRLG